MSMIDVESPHYGPLNHCYRNELLQHTSGLPRLLVERLERTPALMVRERCRMTLGETVIGLVIETFLEQCGPWHWRIHGQHAEPCEYVDPVRLAQWSPEQAPRKNDSSDTLVDSAHTPVLELIARALYVGEEGRDWRMLHRLPTDPSLNAQSAA